MIPVRGFEGKTVAVFGLGRTGGRDRDTVDTVPG